MAIAKKNRGLGRGLDVLLGANVEADAQALKVATAVVTAELAASGAIGQGGLKSMPVTRLRPGVYQPRSHMDEAALNTLAQSIKDNGLMQPILIRLLAGVAGGEVQYEIIAGERRWRAAQIAGLTEVPVIIKDVPDEKVAVMALIENIQREDLNPLEEAQGIERLVREFGLTHEQAAQAVGRSRSATSNLLRLLNLAKPVQTMLMAGDLDMGHARALLSVTAAEQVMLAHEIVQKKLNVREAEKLVAKFIEAQKEAKYHSSKASKDTKINQNTSRLANIATNTNADTQALLEELSDTLGAQVELISGKKSAGKLVIHYGNLDALQGVIERLSAK